jgi:hypothetical protein
VFQNHPWPIEEGVLETIPGAGDQPQTQVMHAPGWWKPEAYSVELMKSVYAHIEREDLTPRRAELHLEVARTYIEAAMLQYYHGPDQVARTHMAMAMAAQDEHNRQMVLAEDPKEKEALAKEVYEDRLDVAKFASLAVYHDLAWQRPTMTPAEAQKGVQAKLDAIDPRSPDADDRQLQLYKQVIRGQPEPGLEQYNETWAARAAAEIAYSGKTSAPYHFDPVKAAETYASQLLECAFATVDVKGLTGAAADLQIKAAMAVGEEAVRTANTTTDGTLANYRVKEADIILKHTQEDIELFGAANGLGKVLQTNQNFLLQAIEDAYRLDPRSKELPIPQGATEPDPVRVARLKQTIVTELLG